MLILATLCVAALAQGEARILQSGETEGVPARHSAQRFEVLHEMLPAGIAETADVLLLDVEGDGDLDAYVANAESFFTTPSTDRLYLNNGSGVFRDATARLPEDDAPTTAVVAGDLDGDGDPDLVLATSRFGDENRLYLNEGKSFVDASERLAGSGRGSGVALGDVDGDGALDLWFTDASALFLNDGLGQFTDATDRVPDAELRALELGDLDADGDLDAVVLVEPECEPPQNGLWLNDGDGYFTDASDRLPVNTDGARSIALGDVDDDGSLDVVLASSPETFCAPDGANRLYLNDGTGAFTDASDRLGGPDEYTRGASLADVDGDDDLDLWFANTHRPFDDILSPYPIEFVGQQNRLWLNDGHGFFLEASELLEGVHDESAAGAFGDVDGDGDLDLVVGNDGPNRLLLGDGTGAFVQGAKPMPADGVPCPSVALGDIDGDGVLDAVVGRGDSLAASARGDESVDDAALYLGDGLGGFVNATERLPRGVYDEAQVDLGDVDRDGDLDLVLAYPIDGEFFPVSSDIFLYLNDGAGNFTDATDQLPSYGPGDDRGVTLLARLVDVDLDGAADLFLAGRNDYDGGGGGVELLLNDGDGNFTLTTGHLDVFWYEIHFLEVADVNADGAPDLVVAGSFPSGVSVLLNDGAGVFQDTGAMLPDYAERGFATALTLGDADGDGGTDVVCGWTDYAFPPADFLFLNDGQGGFSESVIPLPQTEDELCFVDVDDDGDADLLGNETLLENDGRGRFRDSSAWLPADTGGIESMAFGDLDRDGDVDAFLAREAGSVVWSNLTRHVAWRGEPRLGQPLVLDVYGPGRTPAMLLASMTAHELPTPFGLLHLDPSTLFVVEHGLLPLTGHAHWSLRVPALPALLGETLHWQALVGRPLRLSNLESTTFSDL